MPWLSDNRNNKKIARDLVFNCGPKKSVLLLPGYRCECVKLALSKGVITPKTICTFAERDPAVAEHIRWWVEKEWTYHLPIIHEGELHEMEMHPIDLGYIDLFGNLTKVEMEWVKNQLIPNLMPNADLAFTFSVPIRGNEFMKAALATMQVKYPALYEKKMERVACLEEQVRPVAALYACLFEQLLTNYDYEIDFHNYRDRGPFTMLLVRLTKIAKKPHFLMMEFNKRNGKVRAV